MFLFHSLFKPEHTIRKLIVCLLFRHIRVIRIRMVTVEKLYDMKAAAVHIEVDVSLFKIRQGADTAVRQQPDLQCSLCRRISL